MSNRSHPSPWRTGARALLTCGLLALPLAASAVPNPAAAAAADARLAEQQYQGIAYATGGISPEEAAVFRAHAGKYPLALELLEKQATGTKRDEFTARAEVRIMRDGKRVFDTQAAGPFMLVRLEPGTYSMTATLGKRTLRKTHVRIEKGRTTRATFEFPANTD
jgi:hypothetical protein